MQIEIDTFANAANQATTEAFIAAIAPANGGVSYVTGEGWTAGAANNGGRVDMSTMQGIAALILTKIGGKVVTIQAS